MFTYFQKSFGFLIALIILLASFIVKILYAPMTSGGSETSTTTTTAILYPVSLVTPDFLTKHGIGRVILVNDDYYYNRLPFHKLKLAYLRATSAAYISELDEAGFEVSEVHDLSEALKTVNIVDCISVDPIDDVPRGKLATAGIKVVDSPNFLLTHSEALAAPHPHAAFYKFMRGKFNVLLDRNQQPIGGKYSFDEANRKPFGADRELAIAADKDIMLQSEVNKNIKIAACEWATTNYPNSYGEANAANMVYPVSRGEAADALAKAIKRLPLFGAYQDAIDPAVVFGFHSVLSAALNVGLVTPRQVLDAALAATNVPIESLEAFVRQIIGWREYIRSVYAVDANVHRAANDYGHTADVPAEWYNLTNPSTGITLVDDILTRINKYAYAHHIERLMVLGSLLNMMGVEPNKIADWFITVVAIDAYDWVMVPNITMCTFRTKTMTTRPYVSGYNYIAKMARTNVPADKDAWNKIYHDYLRRHAPIHKKNYFMARQLRLVK